ncbi:MAG: M13 family metallopeptidase [Marinilabiliales bacterium]|nr:M13 family metallopeptidase [Marinilabiliales bacterium]
MLVATVISCSEPPKKVAAPAIDPANLDKTVVPGNDFDTYANGGWKKLNPLPADRSRFGSFDKLSEEAESQLNTLVKNTASANNPKGSVGDKIATLFNSGMDTAKIEKQGYDLLKPYLQEIDQIKNMEDVQKAVIRFHKSGMSPLFGMYGSADARNSTMVIAQLCQAGMGLPDRDYYLLEDAHSAELRAKYVEYITSLFKLIGTEEAMAKANAQKVLTLETSLAKASMSRLEQRSPEKTYNKVTTDELIKLSPVFQWKQYFADMGVSDPGSINLNQPIFIKEVSNLLTTVPVEDWKIYLTWNLVNESASYLSSPFVQASFDFYGKAMTGAEVMRPRWKRVQGVTSNVLSEALGQLYVQAYFPQASKDRMVKLVENLRTALGERIQGLEWMSPETKQKAIEKLQAITVKIGYPDKWRDYSGLEIKDDSYVLNVFRANQFETAYNMAKINKPVDRLEWGMSPQTVNAYYNPSINEIVFPAAILQPPFFFKDGDDAVNYGAIGVVIGHEMSHGFDDEGRKFDKVGNLTDWWTPEDSKRFDERAKVLVDQFNKFAVLDTVHANGALCLGENIADLGGLNISYTAFRKVNAQKDPIDGFTPDQRFFLAYAHVWGQNIRDKEILRRTKEDVHSLGRFRVLGPLQNLPEFYAAFDVKEGQAMYLAPDKRAKIW